MFGKHWEFATGRISSARDENMRGERNPQKIAQSEKAKKIYLGDGFELGGRRLSQKEEKKSVNFPRHRGDYGSEMVFRAQTIA